MLEFVKKMVLRTSDYDTFDQVKMHSLLDVFQDMAGDHAKLLKMGYYDLKERDLIWVLVSTKIQILGNVPYNEEVTVRTWPHERGKIDFIRDYDILGPSGDVIVKASAKWIVLNYKKRRIERAPEITFDGEFVQRTNFEDVSKLRVSIPHNKEFIRSYKVSNNDLDHNGHMNNSKYMELVYNSIDLEKTKMSEIHIDYLKEAYINDTIDLYKFNENDDTYYVGYLNLDPSFIVKVKE